MYYTRLAVFGDGSLVKFSSSMACELPHPLMDLLSSLTAGF